jgi:hypothetical protein
MTLFRHRVHASEFVSPGRLKPPRYLTPTRSFNYECALISAFT